MNGNTTIYKYVNIKKIATNINQTSKWLTKQQYCDEENLFLCDIGLFSHTQSSWILPWPQSKHPMKRFMPGT